MMKMATGDDFPSGRVLELSPDWFLVSTEACGGGNPDLGSILGIWGYIRGVGIGDKTGEFTRGPQGWSARPTGVGRPPLLW